METYLLGTSTWWFANNRISWQKAQTLQQESLIVALSKCVIKIGFEKISENFNCFVSKFVLCQQGRFSKIRSHIVLIGSLIECERWSICWYCWGSVVGYKCCYWKCSHHQVSHNRQQKMLHGAVVIISGAEATIPLYYKIYLSKCKHVNYVYTALIIRLHQRFYRTYSTFQISLRSIQKYLKFGLHFLLDVKLSNDTINI